MKVAILTLMDDSNIGNRLQNYAVQTILEKKGHEAISLYYSLPNAKLYSWRGITGAIHDFLLYSGIRSSTI